MNKQEVMKALECCFVHEACGDCPYHDRYWCDRDMCEDAIALLKSADKTTAPSQHTYHTTYIYTKRDNLSNWFNANRSRFIVDGNLEYSFDFHRVEDFYAQERDVQLILLVRHETVQDAHGDTITKCYCKIKCPINPLPIKGEFEAVTAAAVGNLLKSLGWHFKEKIKFDSPLYE